MGMIYKHVQHIYDAISIKWHRLQWLRFVDVDKVAAETSCPFYYQRLFKPSSRLGQE